MANNPKDTGGAPQGPELVPDPLPGFVRPGDGNAEAAVEFHGYLTRTSSGLWRLYVGEPKRFGLSEWIEFQAADVVHSEKKGAGDDQHSIVWLKTGARAVHVRSEGMSTQGEFLRGEISREFQVTTPSTHVTGSYLSRQDITGEGYWWCTWKLFGCTKQMLQCTQMRGKQHRTQDIRCDETLNLECEFVRTSEEEGCTPDCGDGGGTCGRTNCDNSCFQR